MTSLRIALLLATLAVASAAPAPTPANDNTPEIIEIIAPAASAQETLDSLNLGQPGSELSERNKRTIGILRQLFPTLTQIVEQKIQNLTSQLFQTFGPIILNAISGSRGNRGPDGNSGVDTFDDEEEDNDIEEVTSAAPAKFASDAEPVPNVKMTDVPEPIEKLTELNPAGTQTEKGERVSSSTEIKVALESKDEKDEDEKTETSSENATELSSQNALTTENQDTKTTKAPESEPSNSRAVDTSTELEDEDSDNETTKRKRTIATH